MINNDEQTKILKKRLVIIKHLVIQVFIVLIIASFTYYS